MARNSKCGAESAATTSSAVANSNVPNASTTKAFKSTFKSPLAATPANGAAVPTLASSDAAVLSLYYLCMHTKDVKKKHKVFDEGVLAVRGGACTLYAMDGATLSKSSSYSAKVLASLVVGSELRIGARDVEVGEPLDRQRFESGAIFLGEREAAAAAAAAAVSTAPASTASSSVPKFKKFVSHRESFAGELAPHPALSARHDPNAEGAIVLWQPPTSADVAIVVDPFLAVRLRPHQVAAVRFLFDAVARGTGCILADEMGLGKTLSSITLLWTVLKQGTPALGMPVIAKRAVIAVPTSLTANWAMEIKKWLGPERLRPISIIDDDKVAIADKLRTFAAASYACVLIISYEQLRIHADALRAVGPISVCICDEGHRLKNPNAALTKALRALQCQSRIILSGTPIQNELNEFYAMLSFACPQLLETLTPAAFKRLYTNPIMRAREADAKPAEKELGAQRAAKLAQLTAKCVLRRTAALLNKYLPPLTQITVFCALSDTQRAVYQRVVRDKRLLSMLAGAGGADENFALEYIALLKKLCNHPALLLKTKEEGGATLADKFDVRSLLPTDLSPTDAAHCDPALSGKLGVLLDLLAQVRARAPRDRVVLVSNYTQTLDVLALVCGARHYPLVRLDGSTSLAQRQSLVNRWNDKANDLFVFLLSTKAGGVGLNLVGANRLVLFDSDWNPANDLQALARVHRDGQTQHTYVYRLLATGTIDEKIFQRQLTKLALSKTMLAKGAARAKPTTSSFSREELRDIFSFNGSTKCDTHSTAGCACDASTSDASAAASVALPRHKATHELGAIGEMQHCATIAQGVDLDPALVAAADAIGERVTFLFAKTQAPNEDDDGGGGDGGTLDLAAAVDADGGNNEDEDEADILAVLDEQQTKRARIADEEEEEDDDDDDDDVLEEDECSESME
jgi:DNA repair and recombination protein RAD54B